MKLTKKELSRAKEAIKKLAVMGASIAEAEAEINHYFINESKQLRDDMIDKILNDDDFALRLTKELN